MLRSLPGVKAATVTNQVRYGQSSWNSGLELKPDQPLPTTNATTYLGDEQFLKTMGLKLVAGRDFNADVVFSYRKIREPGSELGEHVVEYWTDLVGPANRSLVHWLRRLVFRGAWLDQRVKEGELDIVFDEETHTFGYVQPERDSEPIELSREPSWGRVAYRSE